MVKRLVLVIVILKFCTWELSSQVKPAFSGESENFKAELITYMGINLTPDQKQIVNSFIAKWDSSGFTSLQMNKIVEVSGQLGKRKFRPIPHFTDLLKILTDFAGNKKYSDLFPNFLAAVSKMSSRSEVNNDLIDRFIKSISVLMNDNTMYSSNALKWKIKGENLKFVLDSTLKVIVNNVTISCYAQKDSTEIFNVNGIFYPDLQIFTCKSGIITWEKSGYDKNEVFAEIRNYQLNLIRNSFSVDSARLTYKKFFKEPVMGVLTDQAYHAATKERNIYPRFETYAKKISIKNIYKDVNYEGGLALAGSTLNGIGDNYLLAKLNLYRNDTLYVKLASKNFQFSKAGINSNETAVTLYLGNDSIFHSSQGFSYNPESRQVNIFRTNNPVSKSPYYDSFHGLDISFEYLIWNMNDSKIVMSRARGASIGEALFESSSFFNFRSYEIMMGLDENHPLNRLKQFAAYFYSETFPVTEFAKWMKMPEESVAGLCIDLANKGFVFYDRVNNEVTIKKKTDHFLSAAARKKDYDVISIYSETNAPQDNAVLDLKNFRLTVNGVDNVALSDSQKVTLFPYKSQLVIGKNRSISFDGVVEAGLFTIFGHNFTFSYDTFKIRLQKIDSILIKVETEQRDVYGNAISKPINSMIQLTTAELYIDQPDNKSGLKSLQQYPIINAVTYSYIFYDKIPGLEGIYKQKDFYFRIDPFTYENIDHYRNKDMNLAGQFFAGNILKQSKQFLSIQDDNSLGFSSNLPDEGLDLYNDKGRIYDHLSLSNRGLLGSGRLKRLTSGTVSDEYKFFPDSMLSMAKTFDIAKDETGKYPELKSTDISIKWLPEKDEWLAINTPGKKFDMFANGTSLDGKLILTPTALKGSGIIDMSNSRIESKGYKFATNTIQADTADYNFKALQGDGYAFIAENANTVIDFGLEQSRFRLNTDSSLVKLPELEYICKMTDFTYSMRDTILTMEMRGKSSTTLMPAEELIKQDLKMLEKPTFFSTNKQADTISFSSWKGTYHLNKGYLEAENINYIHIADALIQPENGKVNIYRRASIKTIQNSLIAVNNKHLLHSGSINIETSKRYSGTAVYNYIDENKEIQPISFTSLEADKGISSGKGYLAATQGFKLSPAFTFAGDVSLTANDELLTFTGQSGIIHNCSKIKSYSLKFKSQVDPKAVMIPISDKPRDINDNLIFAGSFIDIDSTHIYPAFLSARKTWSDVPLVNSEGFIYFDKAKGVYKVAQKEKIADPTLPGNVVNFDKNFCVLSGEGKLSYGANYDLFKMNSAGKYIHNIDSGKVNIDAIIGFDFFFSNPALKIMSDDIRMIPTLRAVNLNSEFYTKGMKDLLGEQVANQIKEEMDIGGATRNIPKEFTYELLLNDVKLYWNQATSSFRGKGKIGIGFIGPQPINVYVDGLIEIQRRRTGDMLDIYLKADESTWYYFSYIRGVLFTFSSNTNYNNIINTTKANDRKHPDATVRVPYSYMISLQNRVERFIQRMSSDNLEDQPERR